MSLKGVAWVAMCPFGDVSSEGLVKHFAYVGFRAHTQKSDFFKPKNSAFFVLQLILEYTRKLVSVVRCPFSDSSSEGLVNLSIKILVP